MDSLLISISETKSKKYEISFQKDEKSLIEILKEKSEAQPTLIVTDENVFRLYRDFFLDLGGNLVVLSPGEKHKNWNSIEHILEKAFEKGLDRSSLFISIGGGVVGDITGFAASIFLRGVSFLQVPTTLLSMVDASVGGKTGIDSPYGKNLIGTFHHPEKVIIHTPFLETLSKEEIQNGLSEMIKHGILGSKKHFEDLEAIAHPEIESDSLLGLIRESLIIKQRFVETDERESNIRGHLNLGHTYGHAIEHLSEYEIPHGRAVAMGCVLAAKKSQEIGWISLQEAGKIENIFEKFGIDTHCPFPVETLLGAMGHDKKRKNGHIRLILPKKIGEVDYYEI